MTEPRLVDSRGHVCPTPSLRLMKAMAGAPAGTVFVLLATDPMARIDVPYLMTQKNGRLLDIQETEGVIRLTVQTG
ncbi:sulfurtransferase TusA family protein [Brevundimonas sp. SL130]|uniref:sulfurtransferase TusA family protein n=1 Tax=Brevundimonas sp. SL130 TaxID=2995143 RepID=UPI00226CA6C8|nr:sulfurtransferase TusA family protein [Brevundimonas sp. SL130]WAC58674.1 sulfurtransferase TusA family protein [Brevundimonas sp. SL130]